jgi:hypothetical protein
MTPASMIVSESMTGHHIVEKQSIERSLAMRIVVVLLVREAVLVVVLLHRRGRVELVQLILVLRIAELDGWYRIEIKVLAEHHLRAAIGPHIVLPRVRRILHDHVSRRVAIDDLRLRQAIVVAIVKRVLAMQSVHRRERTGLWRCWA